MGSLVRNNSEKKKRNGWQSRFARRRKESENPSSLYFARIPRQCPTRDFLILLRSHQFRKSFSQNIVYFFDLRNTLIDKIINQKLSLETYLLLYHIVIFNTRQYVLWLYFNTRNYHSRFIWLYKIVLDFKVISLSFTIFRNNFIIKISYWQIEILLRKILKCWNFQTQ